MESTCRIFEMGYKEVINTLDGARLGYIRDVEIDIAGGRISAVVVPGRLRLWGLLGREPDIIIPWKNIERIGDDIILVKAEKTHFERKRSEYRLFGK